MAEFGGRGGKQGLGCGKDRVCHLTSLCVTGAAFLMDFMAHENFSNWKPGASCVKFSQSCHLAVYGFCSWRMLTGSGTGSL